LKLQGDIIFPILRELEIKDKLFIRVDLPEEVNTFLITILPKTTKVKEVEELVDDLKNLGWVCTYSIDAELLVCVPKR